MIIIFINLQAILLRQILKKSESYNMINKTVYVDFQCQRFLRA